MVVDMAKTHITLKVTHNTDSKVPRTFFIHLHDVPSDLEVRIRAGEEDIPFTRSERYIRAGFWVAPNMIISITVVQGEDIVGYGEFLVHDDKIFEHALHRKGMDLIQVSYMY